MKKKILITGGGGFIGGHMANYYLKKGYRVSTVDLKSKKLWFQKNSKIENIKADCRDPIVCDKLTKGVDSRSSDNTLVKKI